MNFEQLVRYTLEYNNQLRYYHWQTPSYAQHEALGKLYDSITGILDTLVETWQGRNGNIKVDQGKVDLVDYEDVETVIEENSQLTYKDRNNADQSTHQITVVSIDTDEGVLEPLAVGEMLVEVRY